MKCECKGGCPCAGENDAYIYVMRGDKEIAVCTKCILSKDKRTRIIPDVNIEEAYNNTKDADMIDMLCMVNDAKNYAN